MVQQPLGYNQPPYYGPAPYDQASYGAPPRGTGGPLVLAPSSLPDSRAAPLPPPIAVEPLLPPPGSNTEDTFVPRSLPDDATAADNPNPPSFDYSGPPGTPQDAVTGAGATPGGSLRSDDQSAPPIVGPVDAAAQPAPDVATSGSSDQSIQQQLAAIKQNLVQQAPPSATGANPPIIEVRPDHTRYGGLSSSGDVGTH